MMKSLDKKKIINLVFYSHNYGKMDGSWSEGRLIKWKDFKEWAKLKVKELSKREHYHSTLTPDCMHIKKVKCNKTTCAEIVRRKHMKKFLIENVPLTKEDLE